MNLDFKLSRVDYMNKRIITGRLIMAAMLKFVRFTCFDVDVPTWYNAKLTFMLMYLQLDLDLSKSKLISNY